MHVSTSSLIGTSEVLLQDQEVSLKRIVVILATVAFT